MIPQVNWKCVWGVLVWTVLCGLPTRSQELPNTAVQGTRQSPPSFGVLDRDGFFYRNPSALERISTQIRNLEQDRGYMVYLVVESALLTSSASDRASELQRDWLPRGNGLVIVYESDSRDLGIGRDLTSPPATSTDRTLIPTFESSAILTKALTATDRELAPDAFLENFVTKVVSATGAYFQSRTTPPPADRTFKLGLLVLGTFAVLGLGVIGVGSLLRHPALAGPGRYRFPAVDACERLGAPAGAEVTTRSFARRNPPD
jgi:hypothetical protein